MMLQIVKKKNLVGGPKAEKEVRSRERERESEKRKRKTK